jgi:hypothetical protein
VALSARDRRAGADTPPLSRAAWPRVLRAASGLAIGACKGNAHPLLSRLRLDSSSASTSPFPAPAP